MSGAKYFESVAVRLLFSAVIIFLSIHLINDFRYTYSGGDIVPASSAVENISADSQLVTLYLSDYSLLPHLRVLVNGEVKGTFNSRYLALAVNSGDVIAVDGTFYKRPVKVEVYNVSKNIKSPRCGDRLQLNGNVASLGKTVMTSH